jgi:hypothetical protein
VTDVDLAKFFIPTFMAIAMAKVSMSAAEARANGFLGPQDRIVFNRDYLIGEAKKEVLKMVDEGYAPPVKRPVKVFGAAAQGMIDAELFNMQSAKYVSEYDAFSWPNESPTSSAAAMCAPTAPLTKRSFSTWKERRSSISGNRKRPLPGSNTC